MDVSPMQQLLDHAQRAGQAHDEAAQAARQLAAEAGKSRPQPQPQPASEAASAQE